MKSSTEIRPPDHYSHYPMHLPTEPSPQLRMLNTMVSSRHSVLSHLKRFYCSVGTMFLLPVWNNVYGFDTSCIRKQAMAESLVDTFDSKEMVTSDVLVKTMDISEMASGDVSFTAPFKLIAEHDDYIHAFVAYFNVLFTQCHKEISFLPAQDQRLHTGNKMFFILMKF